MREQLSPLPQPPPEGTRRPLRVVSAVAAVLAATQVAQGAAQPFGQSGDCRAVQQLLVAGHLAPALSASLLLSFVRLGLDSGLDHEDRDLGHESHLGRVAVGTAGDVGVDVALAVLDLRGLMPSHPLVELALGERPEDALPRTLTGRGQSNRLHDDGVATVVVRAIPPGPHLQSDLQLVHRRVNGDGPGEGLRLARIQDGHRVVTREQQLPRDEEGAGVQGEPTHIDHLTVVVVVDAALHEGTRQHRLLRAQVDPERPGEGRERIDERHVGGELRLALLGRCPVLLDRFIPTLHGSHRNPADGDHDGDHDEEDDADDSQGRHRSHEDASADADEEEQDHDPGSDADGRALGVVVVGLSATVAGAGVGVVAGGRAAASCAEDGRVSARAVTSVGHGGLLF